MVAQDLSRAFGDLASDGDPASVDLDSRSASWDPGGEVFGRGLVEDSAAEVGMHCWGVAGKRCCEEV